MRARFVVSCLTSHCTAPAPPGEGSIHIWQQPRPSRFPTPMLQWAAPSLHIHCLLLAHQDACRPSRLIAHRALHLCSLQSPHLGSLPSVPRPTPRLTPRQTPRVSRAVQRALRDDRTTLCRRRAPHDLHGIAESPPRPRPHTAVAASSCEHEAMSLGAGGHLNLD